MKIFLVLWFVCGGGSYPCKSNDGKSFAQIEMSSMEECKKELERQKIEHNSMFRGVGGTCVLSK